MSSHQSLDSVEKAGQPRKPRGPMKRKIIIAVIIAVVFIVGLALGLGVGLTRQRNEAEDNNSPTIPTSTPNSNATSDPSIYSDSDTITPSKPLTDNTTMWHPAVGLSWNYVLLQALNSIQPNNTQVWDIDLFDNSRNIITGLQQNNAKVICYFSAGSYEEWRPDHSQFSPSDMGNDLSGWAGERWLNISSPSVRKIMLARLDLAVQKGCNAVDPDNVDGYNNDNGLDLTQAQSIDYLKFLANAAHSRGLAIGLKNAGEIVTDVLPYVEFSVNEQCSVYKECSTFSPFISAGKPVFHVEYPKGDSTNDNKDVSTSAKAAACGAPGSRGFSSIIKNIDLDLWVENC